MKIISYFYFGIKKAAYFLNPPPWFVFLPVHYMLRKLFYLSWGKYSKDSYNADDFRNAYYKRSF